MSELIIQKARLKILEAEKEKPQTKEDAKKRNDLLLMKALEDLIDCTKRIPEEVAKLEEEITILENSKDIDKFWEIRKQYALYQIDIIKKTYPLYEKVARERLTHYNSINSRNMWGKEKDKCAEDTQYWFKWWAWTADPRVSGMGWALPFIPYDFQKEAIDKLENHIFVKKSDLLFEKSRDMGFSWILVTVLYKHWQHGKGDFQALIGSMTMDDTDVVGNPSTLFEKIRTLSNLQPKGLLPRGFNGDIPFAKCVNPETGATIMGEPCNERFGRGGRYKVIIMDELSAVEHDTEALTACSQSSPCRIYNATVRGMGNEFAQLRHSGAIPVYTFHWRIHPLRDERWYNFQKLQLNSPTRVAQELDIDYTASTPNRVYPDWNEPYHVVTKSEVMRALPSFKGATGFKIPFGHHIAMGEDVSMGDGCAHVLYWFTTLRQNTVTEDGIDLTGSILCYREVLMPPKSTPRKTAQRIYEVEDKYEHRMVLDRWLSHEAKTERQIYEEEHNLSFSHWKTDYWDGISRVRDYLEIQYENEPHPFRDFTRYIKYKDKAPPIMGRPKIFFVVDDDQGEITWEQSTNKWMVSRPTNSGGMARLRAEFPVYHFATPELGKEVLKMRPKKIFDDSMDVIRCVASEYFPPISKLTLGERAVNSLPERLTTDRIEELPPQDLEVALIQRQLHLQNFIKEEKSKDLNWRDKTFQKAYGHKQAV